MFDIGGTELLVVGVVALIVIGPKDLPDMFRQLGRFTAKLRSMAREFQRAMDQAAKESGAADLAKDVRNIANPKSTGVDAMRSAADKFEKWDPLKNAVKPSAAQTSETIKPKPLVPPAMPATPAPAKTETPVGPATQTLYDKKAAKDAILKEAAAKLKAIDKPPAEAAPKSTARKAPAEPDTKAATKPAAKPPAAVPTAVSIAAAKAPRKSSTKPAASALK
jgi:sec-independent protein translocase protein TatB